VSFRRYKNNNVITGCLYSLGSKEPLRISAAKYCKIKYKTSIPDPDPKSITVFPFLYERILLNYHIQLPLL
jgi:hypothetical protein